MLQFKTLSHALETFQPDLNSPEGVAMGIFAVDHPDVEEDADSPRATRSYLVGSISAMYDHMAAVETPERRNFYEVVKGQCHFYTVYDLPWSVGDSVTLAHAVFSEALRKVIPIDVVAVIRQHTLLSITPGVKTVMRVRWEFDSPSAELIMLSSPEDAGRLFKRVMGATAVFDDDGKPDFSKNPLFYAKEDSHYGLIVDAEIYKENTLLRTAGSVKPNPNGECAGWLVQPSQHASGLEKQMVPRDVFLDHLVCHVAQPETLPIQILDVSKL